MTYRHQVLTFAVSVALSSAAFAESTTPDKAAVSEKVAAEGLYSMHSMVGSSVYLSGDREREVGEVQDVLVAENMKVHGLVVELEDDLEGFDSSDRIFFEVNRFSVSAQSSDDIDSLSYKVYLDDSLDQMREYPRVDNDWWADTKSAASRMWESTKSGAASAWQATKETTNDVIDSLDRTFE